METTVVAIVYFVEGLLIPFLLTIPIRRLQLFRPPLASSCIIDVVAVMELPVTDFVAPPKRSAFPFVLPVGHVVVLTLTASFENFEMFSLKIRFILGMLDVTPRRDMARWSFSVAWCTTLWETKPPFVLYVLHIVRSHVLVRRPIVPSFLTAHLSTTLVILLLKDIPNPLVVPPMTALILLG